MKNFTKRISALLVFLAAAVMTISAAGISSFASAEIPGNGWRKLEDGWIYCDFHSKYNGTVKNVNYKIDGILYSFDEEGVCTGKFSGWTKEDGAKRRYNEGIPYTGWLKNEDGSFKYCLGGYLMTEDFQIGDKIYSFDENGIYTGNNRTSVLTADCGEKISSDTEKFSITVTAGGGKGNSYAAGEPVRMERWEKGQWVDCIGEGVEYSRSEEMAAIDDAEGDCILNYDIVEFEPQKYTNSNFKEGYYGLVFTYWESRGGEIVLSDKEFYALFEAVPPVEVRMSKEIYTADKNGNADIWAYIDINSERLDNNETISNITSRISVLKHGYWEEFTAEIPYTESCDSVDPDGTISLDMSGCFDAESYVATITVDGEKYYKLFRVDKG